MGVDSSFFKASGEIYEELESADTLLTQMRAETAISTANLARSLSIYDSRVTNFSGPVNVDYSLAGYVIADLLADATVSFSGWDINPNKVCRLTIEVHNTGAYGITWPGGIIWANGSIPPITSGAGKVDIFVFTTRDGGDSIVGHVIGRNYSSV